MKHEINYEGKISRKRKLLIGIVFTLLLLMVVGIGIKIYINNYNKHIEKAQYYFNNDEYENASNEVEKLFPKSYSANFIEKVQIMNEVTMFLDSISLWEKTNDYNSLFDSIITGIMAVDSYKEKANELEIKNRLADVRKQYVDKLMMTFAMTEEEANNIPKLSEKDRNDWLYKKAVDRIDHIPSSMTLQITNKNYRIVGDNVYVSGTITNDSNMACYYLEVTVSFFDEYGTKVDEQTKFVTSDDVLQPGGTKYFEVVSHKNDYTKKFSVIVSDFDISPK